MAGGIGDFHGGILALIELIDEHPREVAYECLRLGLRLADVGVSFGWTDLDAVVRCAPRDSALAAVLDPENAPWDVPSQLLHSIEHTLRVLAWQKTEAGARGRDIPEPLPAPWVKDEKRSKIGTTPVSLDELSAFLGW